MKFVSLRSVTIVAVLFAAFGLSREVKADLLLSGPIISISAPTSDLPGSDPTSSTTGFIWSERTYLKLTSSVSVNMTTTGTADSGNSYNPSPGTIAAGTYVNTYLIHTDPVGTASTLFKNMSVTFDSKILGIITLTSGLNNTDASLGNPNTTYPGLHGNSANRGLESPDSLAWVSNDGLTLNFTTGANIDEIRVLTMGTPEPSTLISCATGALFLGIGWIRRRTARSRA